MRAIILERLDITDECPCPYSQVPNKETIKSMEDIEKGIDLVECKDLDDLFHKLGLKK